MHPPIKGNIQFVCKPAYFFKYTEKANVLLGQFFSNAGERYDRISLMQLQHSPVSNFHKKGLVLPSIMGLLIGKSKRYGIGCIRACIEGVGEEKVG